MTGKWVLLSLLLLATAATAGDKEQKAEQLFQRAERINQLRNNTAPAYQLEVHFTIKAPGQPEVPGSYFKDFLDNEHFRRRIVASTFDEAFVRNGQKVYTKSSSSPAPVIISTIETVIPPLFYPKGQKVSRVFSVPSGSGSLDCVAFNDSSEKFCFDGDAKLVGYESYSGRVDYSAFYPFGDHQLPGHFELLANDGTTVVGDLKAKLSSDLKVELFDPPASAGFKEETKPTCKVTTPPVVRSTIDPDLPDGGLQGVVVMKMTIGTDGAPSDIQVVRSLTPANDREAVKAVARWRFKPAACDGKAIPTPINVEVNFRKY
jgi:TonB family protein